MDTCNGLSKSAKSVQDALDGKGLKSKVIELPSSTRTAIEASQTIGCEVAQIIKSLIFRTSVTHRAFDFGKWKQSCR